ncbi:MAG: 30S ribosomal protein S3ae [Candidatus Micrarchaeota archaeon]|nr:30S ribosomal protein S3ae [Candidatus Micrarchaeota archaeon]
MAEVKKTKVVDNWKLKSWYTIHAPEIFEGKEIGQLVAEDEANLKNRIIRIGLGELTGSFSQANAFTSVYFRVSGVQGKTVKTKFVGHELMPSYIKTLLRRRRSIIYQVDDVVTKDGQGMRLKSVSVTAFRVSEAVRHSLRQTMSAEIKAAASEMETNALVQEILFGKFAARIFGKIKKIAPMRRLEIRKSELAETFGQ